MVCKPLAIIVSLFARIVGPRAALFAIIVSPKTRLFASPRHTVCKPLQIAAAGAVHIGGDALFSWADPAMSRALGCTDATTNEEDSVMPLYRVVFEEQGGYHVECQIQ